MSEKLICSLFCKQYQTRAAAYIAEDALGDRHLVVRYDKGGRNGEPEFAAAIPVGWSDKDVMDLLLWPMKDPKAPYPAWEVAARAYGSPELFRWWAGRAS